MTYKAYLFEGAAAGTPATTALTGASVVNTAGGTQTFTAAAAAHGSCGLEFVTTATAQYNISRFLANAANDQMAFSGVFSYLGAGTGNAFTATAVIGLLINASAGLMIQFRVNSANQMAVSDLTPTTLGAALPTLTPGTKYRVEVVGKQSTGAATVNLYLAAGTTPLATWTKASGGNFGSSAFAGAELGMNSANQAGTVRWDDVQFNDGATTEIGAYNPASTPLSGTGTLTPTSGDAPLVVAVNLTAAGGSGTGRLYTVTWGDGTTTGPQSSASFTHTYAAGSYAPSALVTEPA